MLRKIMMVLIAAALWTVYGTAGAQEMGFRPGDRELTLQGSGSSDNDLDNTTASIEGSYGYFFSNTMELGIRQGIGYADIGDGSDNWSGSTRGFLDFHFSGARFQPFLGINLGYLYGDNVNESFIAGPEGGIKVFITDTSFIYGLVEYNFTFDDADEANEAFDDGRFVYAIGLGIRW